jgi:hypothetical protein
MENTKPWLVINSGKTTVTKGEIGKFGGEKPHISFWIDKNEDTRIALWDNGDGTVYFQVTKKNNLLKTPTLIESREDVLIADKPSVTVKVEDDDDLPF